jgi:hypothetical protein
MFPITFGAAEYLLLSIVSSFVVPSMSFSLLVILHNIRLYSSIPANAVTLLQEVETRLAALNRRRIGAIRVRLPGHGL